MNTYLRITVTLQAGTYVQQLQHGSLALMWRTVFGAGGSSRVSQVCLRIIQLPITRLYLKLCLNK